MSRVRERWLLLLVSLVLAFGYVLLCLAGQAVPESTLGSFVRTSWPCWRDALLLLGSLWAVHGALTLGRATGDQMLLPLASLLSGLGWLEILRLEPDLAPKQAMWVAVAAVLLLLWLLLVRDYRRLQDYRMVLLASAVGLQIITMLPWVGTEVNGARLWIRIGVLTFQPVEVVKILVVLFLASYLRDYRELLSLRVMRDHGVILRYLVPLLLLLGGCEVIFAAQHDLGIGLLLFGVFAGMFWMSTGRLDFVLLAVGLFSSLAWFCYQHIPYVRIRFMAWSNPFQAPQDWGLQMVQSLYALAAGGISGTGLGMGQAWRIPEVHTDFIFVALTEELGLIGAAALLLVFMALCVRAFRIALDALNGGDEFGAILAWGLGAIFLVQTFIVVAGTIKMAPHTGITLPFVSYGGSSLVTNFMSLALLLQISARARRLRPSRVPDRLAASMVRTSKVFAAALLLPLVYLTWFNLGPAPALAASTDNPRNLEDVALRGRIVDRRGVPLALTRGHRRLYPMGAMAVHPVGYWNVRYGLSGLEASQDAALRERGLPRDPMAAAHTMLGQPLSGQDVPLTLDNRLQQVAWDALGDRRGAVVALNPESGEILASVSRPAFDPNALDRIFPSLLKDPDSPLVDRALDGAYPPGSVFKVLVLSAALRDNVVQPQDVFSCPGYLDVGGYRIHDNAGEVHGSVTVARALEESCNVTFGQIARKRGPE
ncbi:MAG: FtsW/RodA/SpoVE family cell cycle protein, partial [Candidatus Xenobia bacterium]